MTWKSLLSLLKETFAEWNADKAPRLSAALAYYTIFSIAPILIVIIAVVSQIWRGESAQVQARILAEMENMMGSSGAEAIGTMLEHAGRPGSGTLATILGVAALVFGATGAFAQLQAALNTVWGVAPRPDLGVMGVVRTRLLSFGMVLVVGFLLLVFLVVSAGLSALDAWLTDLTPGLHLLMRALSILISIGVVTLLFAMIYRYLPDVRIAWREVWLGAAITAVLFTLGKEGIGLYLGNSSAASAYGAAGSLVVLLLWIYYSALILFFGAEFTQVYARRHGSRIEPSAHAVRLPALPGVSDDEAEEPSASEAPAKRGVPAPPKPPAPERPSRLRRFAPIVAAFLAGRLLGRRR